MADKKISELNQNPSITGSEEIAEERGGSNYKNTFTQLKDWVLTFITTAFIQGVRPIKTINLESIEGTGNITIEGGTLTDGNGTTANGTAVDLGGTATSNITIDVGGNKITNTSSIGGTTTYTELGLGSFNVISDLSNAIDIVGMWEIGGNSTFESTYKGGDAVNEEKSSVILNTQSSSGTSIAYSWDGGLLEALLLINKNGLKVSDKGGNGLSYNDYTVDEVNVGAWGTAPNAIRSEAEIIANTVQHSVTGEPTGSDPILNMVSLTQAEYDLGTPVSTTLYIITDA